MKGARLPPALILSVFALGFLGTGLYAGYQGGCRERYSSDRYMKIAGQTIRLETVRTAALRQKGLSGRTCMPKNQAMLFVFGIGDQSDHCFWMKDMRFPLDILWLDDEKKVVFSASEVKPSGFPRQYCPNRPTSYVIELSSGMAAKLGVSQGKPVSF